MRFFLLLSQTPFKVLELFFVFQFSIDYLLGFMMSKNKLKFIFNYLNMIDLLTIVPVFALYIAVIYKYKKIFNFV